MQGRCHREDQRLPADVAAVNGAEAMYFWLDLARLCGGVVMLLIVANIGGSISILHHGACEGGANSLYGTAAVVFVAS